MQPRDALVELEHQHADLAGRLEAFSARLLDPAVRSEVHEELREILIAVGMHFGFEESLMEEGKFAGFDHHRRQHMGIMIELGQLLDRLSEKAETGDLVRGADFLAQWYKQHVLHSDTALQAWLNAPR
jgi:hemerythrin